MKTRITLALLLTALLLLSTGAVTGSAPPRYRIETGDLTAGNVRLPAAGAQTHALSAGGAYRLVSRTVSASASSGCCCTWLPCVLNQK